MTELPGKYNLFVPANTMTTFFKLNSFSVTMLTKNLRTKIFIYLSPFITDVPAPNTLSWPYGDPLPSA
jgi:hypothetical protein